MISTAATTGIKRLIISSPHPSYALYGQCTVEAYSLLHRRPLRLFPCSAGNRQHLRVLIPYPSESFTASLTPLANRSAENVFSSVNSRSASDGDIRNVIRIEEVHEEVREEVFHAWIPPADDTEPPTSSACSAMTGEPPTFCPNALTPSLVSLNCLYK